MSQKQFKEALADFDIAVQQNPKNADLYLNRGMVKLRLSDKAGACSDITIAKNLGYALAIEQYAKTCK
jgi:tetratricopeptide (TPR) repeat protein